MSKSKTKEYKEMTLPKIQGNHRYIDSRILEFLKTQFGDTSFNRNIVIVCGQEQDGKVRMKTVQAVNIERLPEYIGKMHISCERNYYITANAINGGKRCTENLGSLNNIVIDFDCHSEYLSDSEREQLLQNFILRLWQDLIKEGMLPLPNCIVYTGRGVQLWWAIQPAAKVFLKTYNQIKQNWILHIEDCISRHPELSDIEVDSASSLNAVGLFRLPFTYNTKSKTWGKVEFCHADRPHINSLKSELSPCNFRMYKRKSDVRSSKKDEPDGEWRNAGLRRMGMVRELRDYRKRTASKGNEMRDLFNFVYYNSLWMAGFSESTAWEKLVKFNDGFICPMSEKELSNVIVTAKAMVHYQILR